MNGPSKSTDTKLILVDRLVGSANESEIVIFGAKTSTLINTGSMITFISESFYDSMEHKPVLHDVSELGLSLSVIGADGSKLPHKGFIEADISVPSLGKDSFVIPVFVVSNAEYKKHVPFITGTNVIHFFKDSCPINYIHSEWQTTFDCMFDDTIPVRTTNNYNLRVGPREIKTLHGIVRNTKDMHSAITEHTDSSLSGDLTICPRVVSLNTPDTAVCVPVRVCNLSTRVVEIPPKSILYTLSSANVVDSWTPDSSQKQEQKPTTKSLEDLSIQIESDYLTSDQLCRAKQVLGNWSDIFSNSPTD